MKSIVDNLRTRQQSAEQSNPKMVQELITAEADLIKGVNMQVDNMYCMIDYVAKLTFADSSQVRKDLGLSEKDLDYIE